MLERKFKLAFNDFKMDLSCELYTEYCLKLILVKIINTLIFLQIAPTPLVFQAPKQSLWSFSTSIFLYSETHSFQTQEVCILMNSIYVLSCLRDLLYCKVRFPETWNFSSGISFAQWKWFFSIKDLK